MDTTPLGGFFMDDRMEKFETIYLSRLQHYLFCPRQFSLIELEDLWVENILTAQGQVVHQRVNQQESVSRGKIKIVRALPLMSYQYGIEGIADVVELHQDKLGVITPYPIEYKRGRPKSHQADEVQLCAQALCLEEMYQLKIDKGALFYGETHRRLEIDFDEQLRELTLSVIKKCRDLVQSGITPHAIFNKKTCTACSLKQICHPSKFSKTASTWLRQQLQEE